jgi:hypothetical protein
VRFKDTNVFLNRINLRPKIHEFSSVFTLKDTRDDEELFMIEHSIFSKYECEQRPHMRPMFLRKAFDLDMKWGKLHRAVKGDDAQYALVVATLWEHFDLLQNIWVYECGHTGSVTISWNDFTYFAKSTKILDGETIDLSTFDRTFILTNVNTHGHFNSA